MWIMVQASARSTWWSRGSSARLGRTGRPKRSAPGADAEPVPAPLGTCTHLPTRGS